MGVPGTPHSFARKWRVSLTPEFFLCESNSHLLPHRDHAIKSVLTSMQECKHAECTMLKKYGNFCTTHAKEMFA